MIRVSLSNSGTVHLIIQEKAFLRRMGEVRGEGGQNDRRVEKAKQIFVPIWFLLSSGACRSADLLLF